MLQKYSTNKKKIKTHRGILNIIANNLRSMWPHKRKLNGYHQQYAYDYIIGENRSVPQLEDFFVLYKINFYYFLFLFIKLTHSPHSKNKMRL